VLKGTKRIFFFWWKRLVDPFITIQSAYEVHRPNINLSGLIFKKKNSVQLGPALFWSIVTYIYTHTLHKY